MDAVKHVHTWQPPSAIDTQKKMAADCRAAAGEAVELPRAPDVDRK